MIKVYAEWNNISARIKALLETGIYVSRSLVAHNPSKCRANEEIVLEAKAICSCINSFGKNYKNILPKNAQDCLNSFITTKTINSNLITYNENGNYISAARDALATLSLLEAQISYYLSDTQVRIQKTVEIAFAHLQRRLVADSNYRSMWQNNENKETTFEKLGGEHFLLHKIWAFKSNATGERTDLVLQEQPIDKADFLYDSVDGMVLTEWKVVKDDKYLEKIQKAQEQAKKYKNGSLYPLMLSNYCYLVMVSEKDLKIPKNELLKHEDNTTYRIINVAYNPDSPSK